jgi:hypothetical protein
MTFYWPNWPQFSPASVDSQLEHRFAAGIGTCLVSNTHQYLVKWVVHLEAAQVNHSLVDTKTWSAIDRELCMRCWRSSS